MKPHLERSITAAKRRHTLLTYSSFLVCFSVFLAVAYGITAVTRDAGLKGSFSQFMRGIQGSSSQLYHQAKAAYTSLWDSHDNPQISIPHLRLYLSPQALHTLKERGSEANRLGVFVASPSDQVPGVLYYDDETFVRVSVRLKGKWKDHRQDNKWSLRIRLKNQQAVLGLREFSLQREITRNGYAEGLLARHALAEDVLTVRYKYVNLSVNDTPIGIMALEEHHTNQLLEAQRRRNSVILSLDDSYSWRQVEQNMRARTSSMSHTASLTATHFHIMELERRGPGKLGGYLLPPFTTFKLRRVMSDPVLYGYYREAVSLLRGYRAGYIDAEAVFDMRAMGKYLALMHLWDASYGFYWTNMRLYYNPLTRLFEPISCENLVTHAPKQRGHQIFPDFFLPLSSEEFITSYSANILRFKRQIDDGSLLLKIKNWEEPVLEMYRQAGENVTKFPLDNLKRQIQFLASNLPEKAGPSRIKPFVSKQTVRGDIELDNFLLVFLIADKGSGVLEFHNVVDRDVVVDEIYFSSRGTKSPLTLPDRLVIPPHLSVANRIKVDLDEHPFQEDGEYHVVATLNRRNAQRDIVAVPYFSPIRQPKYQAAPARLLLKQFAFIGRDRNGGLAVQPGRWRIQQDLITPEGLSLRILPGTELQFDQGARLITHGPLLIEGTADSRVHLTASNKQAGWSGIVVLNAEGNSFMKHVDVDSVRHHAQDDWGLTGAVTFYESTVSIEGSHFAGGHSEDIVNIVRSHFSVENTTFTSAPSDAIDVDYGDGEIHGGRFQNIGGDAIDICGTKLVASGITIDGAHDKAISVGERSMLDAEKLVIGRAGIGVAAKDGSVAVLKNSRLADIHDTAYMAYIKKAEYGRASLEIIDSSVDEAKAITAAVYPSSILIDGVLQEHQEVGVDELYTHQRIRKGTRAFGPR